MKTVVAVIVALVTCVLSAEAPTTTFAATSSQSQVQVSSSQQTAQKSPDTTRTVQLQGVPVLINGVKYAQNDPHVEKVTQFVLDDAAKAQGVVFGYTSKDQANAQLKSAETLRAKSLVKNTITPQNSYYYSYFYEHATYGGNSFHADYNISWVGSYWNDRISSLLAGYNHAWTVLCWDINYGGAQFWVQSGLDVSYVGSTWNDKASSIFFN
jgi:hypothetical protein